MGAAGDEVHLQQAYFSVCFEGAVAGDDRPAAGNLLFQDAHLVSLAVLDQIVVQGGRRGIRNPVHQAQVELLQLAVLDLLV